MWGVMQKNRTSRPRVALVTGAAKRIGAGIAQALHGAGMNVILHYNTSQEEAESLCFALNVTRAHSAATLQADLLDITKLSALIEQAVRIWGSLDVLVNNASRFYKTPLGLVTEFEWDDLLNSNLKAPFFLAQVAAKHLAKERGTIINIADVHGDRPMLDYSAYCIAKAGMIMLTKSLAKELGPAVRVNAVSPGAGIVWPEGDNQLSDADKEKILDRTVLKEQGEPLDVAKAVLFLAEGADYITGQILTVDGGRSLRI
jgi:pteridine reductase